MFWAGVATGGIVVGLAAFVLWAFKGYEAYNLGFSEGKIEGVEEGEKRISMAQYDRGFAAGGIAANRNRGLKAALTRKTRVTEPAQ